MSQSEIMSRDSETDGTEDPNNLPSEQGCGVIFQSLIHAFF